MGSSVSRIVSSSSSARGSDQHSMRMEGEPLHGVLDPFGGIGREIDGSRAATEDLDRARLVAELDQRDGAVLGGEPTRILRCPEPGPLGQVAKKEKLKGEDRSGRHGGVVRGLPAGAGLAPPIAIDRDLGSNRTQRRARALGKLRLGHEPVDDVVDGILGSHGRCPAGWGCPVGQEEAGISKTQVVTSPSADARPWGSAVGAPSTIRR